VETETATYCTRTSDIYKIRDHSVSYKVYRKVTHTNLPE